MTHFFMRLVIPGNWVKAKYRKATQSLFRAYFDQHLAKLFFLIIPTSHFITGQIDPIHHPRRKKGSKFIKPCFERPFPVGEKKGKSNSLDRGVTAFHASVKAPTTPFPSDFFSKRRFAPQIPVGIFETLPSPIGLRTYLLVVFSLNSLASYQL